MTVVRQRSNRVRGRGAHAKVKSRVKTGASEAIETPGGAPKCVAMIKLVLAGVAVPLLAGGVMLLALLATLPGNGAGPEANAVSFAYGKAARPVASAGLPPSRGDRDELLEEDLTLRAQARQKASDDEPMVLCQALTH